MIDTHCHLDDEAYKDDLDAVIERAKSVNIRKILIPGIDTTNVGSIRQVCQKYPNYALPAIGLHPENIAENYREQLTNLYKSLCEHDDWVAIGEIGLDYHFDKTFVREQRDALEEQLQWAREKDLPVMIHSRDATQDMEAMLTEAAKLGNRGVLHCFTGSYETAKKYLDYGWKLGIGGVLTFKNSKLHEVLVRLPLSSLVLETDGPYLAPTPHRGTRNESAYIPLVAERLAQIYNTTVEQIDYQTDQTAQELFRIEI
ncbi:MAG: TatD family hydrolase [Paludibacteraceae bacterium]|nr:TatD family hydrolase [Paludibacteraceae bacterium]